MRLFRVATYGGLGVNYHHVFKGYFCLIYCIRADLFRVTHSATLHPLAGTFEYLLQPHYELREMAYSCPFLDTGTARGRPGNRQAPLVLVGRRTHVKLKGHGMVESVVLRVIPNLSTRRTVRTRGLGGAPQAAARTRLSTI